MVSLWARVHLGRVSYGSASGPERFGRHGMAVARGGDSSAKGRAPRRPRLQGQGLNIRTLQLLLTAHCQSQTSPTLFFWQHERNSGHAERTFGVHGVFPQTCFCIMS